MKILLAEDDLRLGKMLKTILSKNGINVKWVTNGESAYDECYADGYDVLVLDWMMPGMSGIKLCSILRSEEYQGKILMLTARDSLDDKVNGLTAAGVIAVTALAFNLLLINEVAVPFSSLRSDKEIGLELAQSYRAVDEIGVYGKYSTSAVFYSGKKIIKLVPDEDLANFAPKAYSWKVKNVMPFEGINSFGRRGQLLLVKKNEAGKFLNGSNGKWLVSGEKGGWYILKSA